MSNIGDLGRPIGGGQGAAGLTGTHQADPTEYRESGEHGQGVGVSGGHGVAHAGNSQSGGTGQGNSGFNGGLGSEHASAGIPRSGEHPIADKFMGEDTATGAYQGGSTGDALTGQSHAHSTGAGVGVLGENTRSSGLGAGAGAAGAAGLAGGAIGGAYAGGSANDGLTGQSSAQTTGAGVGPLGENTSDSSRAAALATTAGGAQTQSGVGPAGGAGGHYSADPSQSQSQSQSQSHSHSHSGAAAGAAGAAGLGAGAGAAASKHGEPASDSPLVQDGLAKGTYGHVDNDESRGKPLSNPKDLDTGNPYSLVFDEASGKYLHRHEIEGKK